EEIPPSAGLAATMGRGTQPACPSLLTRHPTLQGLADGSTNTARSNAIVTCRVGHPTRPDTSTGGAGKVSGAVGSCRVAYPTPANGITHCELDGCVHRGSSVGCRVQRGKVAVRAKAERKRADRPPCVVSRPP